MSACFKFLVWCGVACALTFLEPSRAQAQYLRVRDICRIKGQEENFLQGEGIVVGLKGTGDSDPATLRMLARIMERTGNPLAQTAVGHSPFEELKNVKNLARVAVTATIPAEGAKHGDRLACRVSAYNAKSLQGGVLLMTSLLGPNPSDPRIYGVAQGPLSLPDSNNPMMAVVHDGCKMEATVVTEFDNGQDITLLVRPQHASFQAAYEIQEALNSQAGKRRLIERAAGPSVDREENAEIVAEARNASSVVVRIPAIYLQHRVEFVNQILDTQITLQSPNRVVVNERTGVIIIGDNVTVTRVAVTHKNITIHTGGEMTPGPLVVVDQSADSSTTRLKALVDALNSVKVDPMSIIEIIKMLDRGGQLYGQLIIE